MVKIILSLFLIQSSVFAREILCQQNIRDVALRIQWIGQKVVLSDQSPMGYDFLPMSDGPLRPATINWATYQIQQLKGLKSEFTVSWPENQCQWTLTEASTKTRLECSGKAESSVENIEFHTLTLSRLVESTLNEEWGVRRFRLGTSVIGDNGSDFFFVTMPVPESACVDVIK